MATLPEPVEGVELVNDIEFIDYPTNTYYVDPIAKQIRGMTDGIVAMTQAVEIHLSVERYKFQIFTPNFGVEFEGLIGKDYGFIISELKRRIEEAFIPDNRILEVDEFEYSERVDDYITVSFLVRTVYGNIQQTLTLGGRINA